MWLVMNKHGRRYYSDHPRSVARIALKWNRLRLQPVVMVRYEGKYVPLTIVFTSINETMRLMYQRFKEHREGKGE